jgi:hypothetical protein
MRGTGVSIGWRADFRLEVEHVGEFHREIEAAWLVMNEPPPDIKRRGHPFVCVVALPGLAGQVGELVEGDRQVARARPR